MTINRQWYPNVVTSTKTDVRSYLKGVVETDGLTNSDSLYLSKVTTFVLKESVVIALLLGQLDNMEFKNISSFDSV
jgi:hypothetical protein